MYELMIKVRVIALLSEDRMAQQAALSPFYIPFCFILHFNKIYINEIPPFPPVDDEPELFWTRL